MISRRVDRKRKIPLPKRALQPSVDTAIEPCPVKEFHIQMEPVNILYQTITLEPHELRKLELSRIHSIRETDIFVDPVNGVELFRTSTGTWATSPGY